MFPEIVQIPAFSPGKYEVMSTFLGKTSQAESHVLVVFKSADFLEIVPFLLKFIHMSELLEGNHKARSLSLLTLVSCNPGHTYVQKYYLLRTLPGGSGGF